MPVEDWQPVSWIRRSEPRGPGDDPMEINATRGPYGQKYAVRRAGGCLAKSGKWRFEPQPSSRTDAFLKACRFDTLAEAVAAAEKAMG